MIRNIHKAKFPAIRYLSIIMVNPLLFVDNTGLNDRQEGQRKGGNPLPLWTVNQRVKRGRKQFSSFKVSRFRLFRIP